MGSASTALSAISILVSWRCGCPASISVSILKDTVCKDIIPKKTIGSLGRPWSDDTTEDAIRFCARKADCSGFMRYVGTDCDDWCGTAVFCEGGLHHDALSRKENWLVYDLTDYLHEIAGGTSHYDPRGYLDCETEAVGGPFLAGWALLRDRLAKVVEAGFPRAPNLNTLAASALNYYLNTKVSDAEARDLDLLDRDLAQMNIYTEAGITEEGVALFGKRFDLFGRVLGKRLHPSALTGFCGFGLVAIFVIKARNSDTRQDTLADLKVALDSLDASGLGDFPFDFLSSSSWAVNRGFLMVVQRRLLNEDGIDSIEDPLVRLRMLDEIWKPMEPPPSYDCDSEALHSLRSWHVSRAPLRPAPGRLFLQLLVVSSHLTLPIEPVDMIRRAITAARGGRPPTLEVRYYGVPCDMRDWRSENKGMTGKCRQRCDTLGICGMDGPQHVSSNMVDGTGDTLAYDRVGRLEELRSWAARLTLASVPTLLVCAAPFVFCSWLQNAWYDVRQLVVLGNPMTFWSERAVADERIQMLKAYRDMIERAVPEGRAAVISMSPIISAQARWQVGKAPPVVRHHGLFLKEIVWRPDDALAKKKLLIFRNPLWRKMLGHTFLGLLRQFLSGSEDSRTMTYVAEYNDNTKHMPAPDLFAHIGSNYTACVFLPWEVQPLSYYELYSLAIPLIVPSVQWFAYRTTAMPIFTMDVRDAGSGPDGPVRLTEDTPFPSAPWADFSDPRSAFSTAALWWYGQFDFYQMPHILSHFSGFPQLITDLAGATDDDLVAISLGMQEFNQKSLLITEATYADALGALLETAPKNNSPDLPCVHSHSQCGMECLLGQLEFSGIYLSKDVVHIGVDDNCTANNFDLGGTCLLSRRGFGGLVATPRHTWHGDVEHPNRVDTIQYIYNATEDWALVVDALRRWPNPDPDVLRLSLEHGCTNLASKAVLNGFKTLSELELRPKLIQIRYLAHIPPPLYVMVKESGACSLSAWTELLPGYSVAAAGIDLFLIRTDLAPFLSSAQCKGPPHGPMCHWWAGLGPRCGESMPEGYSLEAAAIRGPDARAEYIAANLDRVWGPSATVIKVNTRDRRLELASADRT